MIPGAHKTKVNVDKKDYNGECFLNGNNFIGYNGKCKLFHTQKDSIRCNVMYNSWGKNLTGDCENKSTKKQYDLTTP